MRATREIILEKIAQYTANRDELLEVRKILVKLEGKALTKQVFSKRVLSNTPFTFVIRAVDQVYLIGAQESFFIGYTYSKVDPDIVDSRVESLNESIKNFNDLLINNSDVGFNKQAAFLAEALHTISECMDFLTDNRNIGLTIMKELLADHANDYKLRSAIETLHLNFKDIQEG